MGQVIGREDLKRLKLPRGGQKPSRSLFKQYNPEGPFDLNDWKQRYVDCCDPTEYKGALELCGSWDEWLRFKREWPGFVKIIEEWNNEVEVKIRSEAVMQLVKKAADGEVNSAKFIAKGEYKPKLMGTPRKKEQEKEKNIQTLTARKVDPEVERVLNPEYVDITPQS